MKVASFFSQDTAASEATSPMGRTIVQNQHALFLQIEKSLVCRLQLLHQLIEWKALWIYRLSSVPAIEMVARLFKSLANEIVETGQVLSLSCSQKKHILRSMHQLQLLKPNLLFPSVKQGLEHGKRKPGDRHVRTLGLSGKPVSSVANLGMPLHTGFLSVSCKSMVANIALVSHIRRSENNYDTQV